MAEISPLKNSLKIKDPYIWILVVALGGMAVIGAVVSTSGPVYITVKTDWPNYVNDVSITVSGNVQPIQQPDQSVMVQVLYSDGKLYKSIPVPLIRGTNIYSQQFKIDSLQDGIYDFTVKASYGGHDAYTTFKLSETKNPSLRESK